MLSYIGTVVFSLVASLGKPANLAAMSEHLTNWNNARLLMSAYGWFGILGSLFTLQLSLVITSILKRKRNAMDSCCYYFS